MLPKNKAPKEKEYIIYRHDAEYVNRNPPPRPTARINEASENPFEAKHRGAREGEGNHHKNRLRNRF